jgi:transposase
LLSRGATGFDLGVAGIASGQHARSEALFYYFRLEDQVPETHRLRLIEKHISLGFVRERLKESYSETWRPSIDPELLLRILLIGYLYAINSERRLVKELRMHLAWRWFTGLGFDLEIPHHSTSSKNRHGRFRESMLFEQLFEEIVKQCVQVGLVRGDNPTPRVIRSSTVLSRRRWQRAWANRLALHYVGSAETKFWSTAALIFMTRSATPTICMCLLRDDAARGRIAVRIDFVPGCQSQSEPCSVAAGLCSIS